MKNELEIYIAEKLKVLDKYSRPTRASGACGEISDIYSKVPLYIECKIRNTKNITIFKDVWDKLLSKIPPHQAHKKKPLYILQNKFKDRFAVMNLDDFIELVVELEKLRRYCKKINKYKELYN